MNEEECFKKERSCHSIGTLDVLTTPLEFHSLPCHISYLRETLESDLKQHIRACMLMNRRERER